MKKIRTYAFWVALSSAVVILVQSMGKLFGFEIESSTIESVIMSICGVLVVLGIVTKSSASSDMKSNETDTESKGYVTQEDNNKNDTTIS